MSAGIIAAVTALLGLLSIVLEAWVKAKPQRVEEQQNGQAAEHIQTEREALSGNDLHRVDAVIADQHDRVRLALGGSDSRRGDDHLAETDGRLPVLGQRGPAESAPGVSEQVNG
jgi:hypothetical protein